jgi:hypothetical protein
MLVIVKVVHIVFAAAWFGHKLLIPRDIDKSLVEQSHADGLVRRMHIAERLGIGAGLGTVLTGVGLVFITTGWGEASALIWVALGAALAMFVVGGVIARPAWMRIEAGVAEGDLRKAHQEAAVFKRTLVAENTLWIIALTAMVL